MRRHCLPEHWIVELRDGSLVHVWADSLEGIAGPDDLRDYRFCDLLDVPVKDQQQFDVRGRTPSNPDRILVTVALFPRSAVRAIHGDEAAGTQ